MVAEDLVPSGKVLLADWPIDSSTTPCSAMPSCKVPSLSHSHRSTTSLTAVARLQSSISTTCSENHCSRLLPTEKARKPCRYPLLRKQRDMASVKLRGWRSQVIDDLKRGTTEGREPRCDLSSGQEPAQLAELCSVLWAQGPLVL